MNRASKYGSSHSPMLFKGLGSVTFIVQTQFALDFQLLTDGLCPTYQQRVSRKQ
ncbi:hypothetical protein [Flavobacterium sp. NKUCC04_CG]|uniref:hypothetical protein n=1 Tax=Flavobacterium sp. NKUCC04_CG TaxID=2842121 RepID=UPI001C5BB730|nr:hypothetical protein [Flavobacterium sp. NKUCC04_CG]MBW3519842.1 hypothetical protein [Flavobacterium sp. NKUCC04_CG]